MTDKNIIPDSKLDEVSGGIYVKPSLELRGTNDMIPGVGEKCSVPGCEGTFVFDERCRQVICNLCGTLYGVQSGAGSGNSHHITGLMRP